MDKTAIKTYITAIEQAIKAGNARAELNPVPRDSLTGMKLASVTQWVSDRKTHKSHLPKADPAGQ